MNALVGVRANATGLYTAPPAQRRAVANDLATRWQNALSSLTKSASATRKSSLAPSTKDAAMTSTSSISTTEAVGVTTTRSINKELDRDAFLQLLVMQMRNQDPLEPTSNSEMLAQLAQFSSLEQMERLNDNFENLTGGVDQLNFMTASSLIGKTVSGLDVNGLPIEGSVDRVHLDGSLVYLTIGERLMSMAGVLAIADPVR